MKKSLGKRTEKGLTLIESLVGIMVVATVVTLITPALVVGYATRIKNYRTDQAIKLAKGEIDRVRLQVDRGNIKANDIAQLPPIRPGSQEVQDFDIDRWPAPTPVPVGTKPPACPLLNVSGTTPVTSVCSLDINGDGEWDLGMQTFRSATPSSAISANDSESPVAFLMRVRVYTKAALTQSPTRLEPFPDIVTTARTRKTASLGITSGANISLPLVTFSSAIVRSDLSSSRATYCALILKDSSLAENTDACPGL